MKFTKVVYGRTIEVGRFGRGPCGKVWFGWEVDCEEGNAESSLDALKAKADAQEKVERREFEDRRHQ